MQKAKPALLLLIAALFLSLYSCSVFQRGSGCPADGKAFGAEKILSGEKPPKAKKFRS